MWMRVAARPLAPGDQVCHFAGETGMPPTYLSIGDDGGAEPVAQVHVHEVVECARVAGLTFGASGPVNVVINRHGAIDERLEYVSRGELAEKKGVVGQVDEAASLPVDRIGGAEHGQPGRSLPGLYLPHDCLQHLANVRRASPATDLHHGPT